MATLGKHRIGSNLCWQMEKVEKLPRSALALYVKLYCERKNNLNTKYYNNLTEAKRSWFSLSQDEKDKFSQKYEHYQMKFKKKFANYLKNAEPYLKKKVPHVRPRIPDTRLYEKPQPDDNRTGNMTMPMQLDSVEEERSSINDIVDTLDQQCTNNLREFIQPVLVEPIPPSVINGQELFEFIKRMDENDLTWSTLSSVQKKRYQAAVLSLKKDYIKKYKAYLESLPSKELFDHYNIKCL